MSVLVPEEFRRSHRLATRALSAAELASVRGVSLGAAPKVICSIWLKLVVEAEERMRANSRPWRRKASSAPERRRCSTNGCMAAGMQASTRAMDGAKRVWAEAVSARCRRWEWTLPWSVGSLGVRDSVSG